MDKKVCACPHHKIVPLLVILFAALFFFGNLGYLSNQVVSLGWPIIVGGIGMMKLNEDMCTCC